MLSFSKGFNSKIYLSLVVFAGCSGLEQSEQEKLRRHNAKGEFIHRAHDEYHYAIETPSQYVREKYPWEKAYSGKHSKITKEYFRCRGSRVNPPHVDQREAAQIANYFDCGGFQKHSLPIRDGQEFVYPVLVELLNYVQEKTGCKVVITCGHRCPVHNAYADSSPSNQHSKHLIGAEVDFYVQGMEQKPEEVVNLIMAYYKAKNKEYQEFKRLEKGEWNVKTPPWGNKEILIKLYKKEEGRDFDNRHPYPYIGIQVRFDPEKNEKVVADWQKAFNGYRRF